MNGNVILLADVQSDVFFPLVKEYVNNNINYNSINFESSDVIISKWKVDLIPHTNCFQVPKVWDILTSMEINGKWFDGEYDHPNPDIFIDKNGFVNRRNLIASIIRSIDLEIGGREVTSIFSPDWDFRFDENSFSIMICFDKLFLTQSHLPMDALHYQNVRFIINWGERVNKIEASLLIFLQGAILSPVELRKSVALNEREVLMNSYQQYQMVLNENDYIFMNTGNVELGGQLSLCNFVKSLHFDFHFFNVRNGLKSISIFGENNLLTTLTKTDLRFISDSEMVMEKFYYKTFLFRNIRIEFDMDIPFNNTLCTLTTTNFNVIEFKNGMGCKKFLGLERTISIFRKNGYELISQEIFEEKVLPRLDVCCISHETFEEGEEIIICGGCFSATKKACIEEWFKGKSLRICPYGRCEGVKWFMKK